MKTVCRTMGRPHWIFEHEGRVYGTGRHDARDGVNKELWAHEPSGAVGSILRPISSLMRMQTLLTAYPPGLRALSVWDELGECRSRVRDPVPSRSERSPIECRVTSNSGEHRSPILRHSIFLNYELMWSIWLTQPIARRHLGAAPDSSERSKSVTGRLSVLRPI